MRILLTSCIVFLIAVSIAQANEKRIHRWVDENGVVHYGDSVPAEYAEMDKHILNEHGVTVDLLRGKKSAEEIAEEKRQEELRKAAELRRQQDAALMATYMSIDEIVMHRDRRVELFQAQTRVTELYLRNLDRRLATLMVEAANFQPYSEDPDAAMIDPNLANDISATRQTIDRQKGNLRRFEKGENEIRQRFEVDIERFKRLKGLDETAVATTTYD